jgi:hypothetical protein
VRDDEEVAEAAKPLHPCARSLLAARSGEPVRPATLPSFDPLRPRGAAGCLGSALACACASCAPRASATRLAAMAAAAPSDARSASCRASADAMAASSPARRSASKAALRDAASSDASTAATAAAEAGEVLLPWLVGPAEALALLLS